MIKRFTVILLFACLLPALYAQDISLDRVIAIVGNEAILESDVDMFYKDLQINGELPANNPKCEILKRLIDQKMLVAQAKLDSLGTENMGNIAASVERQIAAQIAQVGGKERLEAYFNKPIDLLKEEMIDMQTQQQYAMLMQRELAGKVSVTPSETVEYFRHIDKDSLPVIPDQYMLYEIVKKPDSEQAIINAKEKLLDLRRRILNGEKFQTLATLYSEDPGSAQRGGETGLSLLEEYVLPIRQALSNMRVGQVSKIIESEYGYHILQLLERQDDLGMVNYRHILIKPKYSEEDRINGFARLDTIVRRIESDSISFFAAALLYSDDEASRTGSGLKTHFDNHTGEIRSYFYKDELPPADFRAIEHLGIGEISEPYKLTDIKGNEMYKVMMLKEFIPSHTVNLKQDFSLISQIFQANKQSEILKNWLDKKAKTEYIRVAEKYGYCPSVNSSWIF
jgi:peptidyl-prolyl cis-trans isomerase SurA